MNLADRSPFEQCVLASGLLTEKQLDEARSGVRWSRGDMTDANAPPSDLQLSDRLVELGLLNPWQAKQLFDGRTKFNLGPYWIIDSIGKGGMGQVFKAQFDKVGPSVAIKVLPPQQMYARGNRQFFPRNSCPLQSQSSQTSSRIGFRPRWKCPFSSD